MGRRKPLTPADMAKRRWAKTTKAQRVAHSAMMNAALNAKREHLKVAKAVKA